jgi:hypothetical protein
MNATCLWNNTIINAHESEDKVNYKLYATGDADMTGRKYVALPANLTITDDVKKQYNIW